jgi:hypothetical protein
MSSWLTEWRSLVTIVEISPTSVINSLEIA